MRRKTMIAPTQPVMTHANALNALVCRPNGMTQAVPA
jgi:hypothetical protein